MLASDVAKRLRRLPCDDMQAQNIIMTVKSTQGMFDVSALKQVVDSLHVDVS
jgi:hypothetical protein